MRLALALLCMLALPAFGEDQPLQPGLAMRLYVIDQDMDVLCELVPGQTPNVNKVVPQLNLSGAKQDFFPESQDRFITEISGFLKIEHAGKYDLRLRSDDGAILTLDGKPIIDNDGPRDGEDWVGRSLELSAGLHSLALRHFDHRGGELLELHWKPPGATDYVLVPESAFFCPADEVKVTSPGAKKILPAPGYPRKVRPGSGMPLEAVHPAYTLQQARPVDFEPRVGGIDFLPDGRMILCTWDPIGGVYIVENHQTGDPGKMTVKRFAAGLAEPLGIQVVDGRIFVLQKQELTELIDHDKDGVADEYRCVCSAWDVTANFHEFAFGLVYRDGWFYAALALAINPGGRTTVPQVADRGKIIRVSMDGIYETVAEGVRTPNGLGIGVDDQIFVTDNQGDWLPSSKLLHLKPGAFYGAHKQPDHPSADRPVTLPVVWMPQGEIGNSPSQPAAFPDGPFKGQLLYGDVTYGGLQRVFVEKVNGEYQGCILRFTQGLEAGVNRIAFGPDGALYIGGIGSSGNWGQTGKQRFGLQRLVFNGSAVFEILAVRARSDGLEIELTQPLETGLGWDLDDYSVQQWRYEPSNEYGGRKLEVDELNVSAASVSEDRRRVAIRVEGIKPGHVAYVRLSDGLRSETGQELWSTEAWYTMNHVPANQPLRLRNPPVQNELTEQEKADGWRLLFDGKTTAGWRGYQRTDMPKGWQVVNGALTRVAGGGDIVTAEEFDNFELQLEWKISPGGNSGIFYRAGEAGKSIWETAPEMQVLDNAGHRDGKTANTSAGSVYAMYPPEQDLTKPVGQWNHVRLVVNGKHIEHWLNGRRVVAYTMDESWKALVANSKFAGAPQYGQLSQGRIGLQDHGDRVAYRNVKIRRLVEKTSPE